MARVIHFEIHADNPERAVAFYQKLFGWEIIKWGGPADYWLIKTGPDGSPGINGGLMKRRGPAPTEGQPVNAFVCTMAVDALDDSLKQLTAAGGAVALPRMAVPGVGWLAYGKDTEGNIFSMMQSDPAAK